MPTNIEIEGEYQSCRWSKDDGSWMIASLRDGTTIVGAANANQFIRGVEYRFSGYWETHQTYGQQFKFTTSVAKEPVTESSVMAYLNRYLLGLKNGIGTAKARKLISEFGPANTVIQIKAEPERVAKICGIELESAKSAAETLIKVEKFESTRMQLVQLFEGRGFSQKCVDECIDEFGVVAADRIRRDPFTLLVRRFHSAGFLRCDQLYRDLGLPEHRLKRQTICLWHQIQQASGSVWIEAEEAVKELKRLISSRVNPKKAIILGRRAKWLTTKRDDQKKLWIAERVESGYEFAITNQLERLTDGV